MFREKVCSDVAVPNSIFLHIQKIDIMTAMFFIKKSLCGHFLEL